MNNIENGDWQYPRNWSKGHKGFKSMLSKTQRLELLECFVQSNWESKPAKTWLKETYGLELKQPTFWYMKNKLKKLWDAKGDPEIDIPAHWNNFASLTKNGVPPEHWRELHKMWRAIETARKRTGSVTLRPTYRHLHWWAYVVEYYGDVIKPIGDRLYIAGIYTVRQMLDRLFNITMETEDIEEWLNYQPWENGDKETAYLQDLQRRVIPAINNNEPVMVNLERMYKRENARSEPDSLSFGMALVQHVMTLAPKPYLLPSQLDLTALINQLDNSGFPTMINLKRPYWGGEEPLLTVNDEAYWLDRYVNHGDRSPEARAAGENHDIKNHRKQI